MKFVVRRDNLDDILVYLYRVGYETPTPFVSIEASTDNTIKLAATNQQWWLEWVIPAEVTETGQVVVKSAELCYFAASLKPPICLEFEAQGEKLAVRLPNGGEYRFCTLPANKFPQAPQKELRCPPIKFNGHWLSVALSKALNAIGDKACGVHIRTEAGDDYIEVIATDKRRFAAFRIHDESNHDIQLSLTLPKEPMDLLKTLIPNEPIELYVGTDGSIAVLSTNEWRAIIPCLNEVYDYREAIPKEVSHQFRVEVLHILPVLRRMAAFNPKRVVLRLTPAGMELSAVDGSGKAVGVEAVKIKWLEGSYKPYTTAFSPSDLIAFFNVTSPLSEVTVKFPSDPTEPTLWQTTNLHHLIYVVSSTNLSK